MERGTHSVARDSKLLRQGQRRIGLAEFHVIYLEKSSLAQTCHGKDDEAA
jgi:hypothetical protein